MSKKQIAGLILTVLVIIAFFFIPAGGLLTAAGVRTIGLLIALLVLLISDALPVMLSCMVIIALMPIIGVTPNFSDALSGFSNQTVFFVLASFGIASAFKNTPLSRRILAAIIKRFGKSVESVLFAIMFCGGLISSLISNLPTCAIFMTIGLSFLDTYENEADKKRSGRVFMIGIPAAVMAGGVMTPAGCSLNLLAINFLEQYTGKTIGFVQWMCAGVPLGLVMIPIIWFFVIKIHKPAPITKEMVSELIKKLDVPEKLTAVEIKVLIVTAVMLILWILSSWVSAINVMVVALVGCCIFCLPFTKILDFKTYVSEISWTSYFLMATVLSLGGAMVSNGVSQWISTLMPTLSLPVPITIFITAVICFAVLIIIPVSPSMVTIMASPLIAFASAAGLAPEIIMLVCGICACDCFLLPLDTVPLLTYGTGYYSITDMVKSSLPAVLILCLLMSVWLPIVGKIFGF